MEFSIGGRCGGPTGLVLLDDEDWPVVSLLSWWIHRHHGREYAMSMVSKPRRTNVPMHTLVTGWPLVDHINHNGLDNRKINLRPATPQQNAWNQESRRGVSRYKGVAWEKDRCKWRASIRVDWKLHHLGRYETEEEAARAYDEAAVRFFGEYAHLNLMEPEQRNQAC